MTYRPAIADACRVGQRGWSTEAYTRRQVPRTQSTMFADLGLSPDVAGLLVREQFSDAECATLARLLSRHAIRTLINDRRINAVTGPEMLSQMAETSLPRTRAWVHRTGVHVSYAHAMDRWGIRPSHIADWVAADPMRRPADPYTLLTVSILGRRVPQEHLAGWLVFATRHHVPFFGQDRSDFLGGDTGLFVRAGISPAEATAMVSAGTVDRDALHLMAGLRA